MTSVYSIPVSNLGTRPQTHVQPSIQVTGSILCVGPLGGYPDPVQNIPANFKEIPHVSSYRATQRPPGDSCRVLLCPRSEGLYFFYVYPGGVSSLAWSVSIQ